MIFSYSVVEWDQNPSTEWIVRRYVASARYNFFMASNASRNWAPDMEEVTWLDGVLAVVTFFAISFRQVIALYADGFLLLVAMMMWVVSKGFKNLVQAELMQEVVYKVMILFQTKSL